MLPNTLQEQYGVFAADNRLKGTFNSLELANFHLWKYGEGAYVRHRCVRYSPWVQA